MSDIIKATVYRLDELSDTAKAKARDWYREGALDHDWYEFVYEDFECICDMLGVSLRSKPVRLLGGGKRQKPCIWFTGFWSQGDGACFEGQYRYAPGAVRKIRDYASKDDELHRIAAALQAIQRRNFFQLSASIVHRGRYHHEYCMEISVARDGPTGQDMTSDAENEVVETLRDLARWLYRQLERE